MSVISHQQWLLVNGSHESDSHLLHHTSNYKNMRSLPTCHISEWPHQWSTFNRQAAWLCKHVAFLWYWRCFLVNRHVSEQENYWLWNHPPHLVTSLSKCPGLQRANNWVPMSNHLLAGFCSSAVSFSFIYHIFLFLFLVDKIWGGDLRGLLLPEFGHCCRTLCQVQTAGGAVDHTGQELAVFPAGRCSCHQSQVRHVTHYLEQDVNAKSTFMFKWNVIF